MQSHNKKSCVVCFQDKGRDEFHKKQWKLEGMSKCIACCGDRPHKCAACQQEKARDGFSKKQWKEEAGKCIPCMVDNRGKREKEQPHKCAACQEEKVRCAFSKKQWKEEAGICNSCVNNDNRRKKEKGQRTEDSSKRKADGAGDAHSAPKQTAVESTCITCQAKFVVSQKKKRLFWEPKCNVCVKAEERKEIERDKASYYLEYGVGYNSPNVGDLCFKKEPLVNESLVGKYKLIYYYSFAPCGEVAEDMHRTARGTLNLKLQSWDEKPALHGDYQIDTRTSNGIVSYEESWGATTSSSFIEHVTNWDPPVNGFNIFSHSSDEGKEKTLFVVDRSVNTSNDSWWSDLEDADEDEYYNYDHLMGAKLRILGKSTALVLQADRLCGNDYCPNAQEIRIASDSDDNLGVAEQLMKKYREGSNSWMCDHLKVPSSVAFLIREYVSPPPVFYLQEDDLILEVEESESPSWDKLLVFRKEA
jgi:hypothetical protein